jgi:hypothetical protein
MQRNVPMSEQSRIQAPRPDDLRKAAVPRLVKELEQLGDIVAERFTPLNAEQLNWKPAPDEWSIGQCLDHLITTDVQYLPIMEQEAQGTRQTNFWQRLPVLPGVFGSMLYNSLHPETATKSMQSPNVFRPSESEIGLDICDRFQAHQAKVMSAMQGNQEKPIDTIIISSPVASWLVYSLGDAFRVIVVHQYLHLMQAERVLQAEGYR